MSTKRIYDITYKAENRRHAIDLKDIIRSILNDILSHLQRKYFLLKLQLKTEIWHLLLSINKFWVLIHHQYQIQSWTFE